MTQLAQHYLQVALKLLEKAERCPEISTPLKVQAYKAVMQALEEMGRG